MFVVDIAVCVGIPRIRQLLKNPPGSALGILATLQSPPAQMLSRVASAILGKRRAGTYLRRLLAAPVHQPQQFQQQVDS